MIVWFLLFSCSHQSYIKKMHKDCCVAWYSFPGSLYVVHILSSIKYLICMCMECLHIAITAKCVRLYMYLSNHLRLIVLWYPCIPYWIIQWRKARIDTHCWCAVRKWGCHLSSRKVYQSSLKIRICMHIKLLRWKLEIYFKIKNENDS
jgi:hypothetical protein